MVCQDGHPISYCGSNVGEHSDVCPCVGVHWARSGSIAGVAGNPPPSSQVVLDAGAWSDLLWWQQAFQLSVCRRERPAKTVHLAVTWGDDSGTGTGGTVEAFSITDSPQSNEGQMETWMGIWNNHVTARSSNWRELNTLQLTLEQELQCETSRFTNAIVFYFTDNTVTYHVVTSGSSKEAHLQATVHAIKQLELELHCHLICIHLPGYLLIRQGTDGLSQGVWVSALQDQIPSRELLGIALAPVCFTPRRMDWLQAVYPLPFSPNPYQDAHTPWNASHVRGRHTIWTPRPKVAAQTISFVLKAWIEQPHTSSAVFGCSLCFDLGLATLVTSCCNRWDFLTQRVPCYSSSLTGGGPLHGPFCALHSVSQVGLVCRIPLTLRCAGSRIRAGAVISQSEKIVSPSNVDFGSVVFLSKMVAE